MELLSCEKIAPPNMAPRNTLKTSQKKYSSQMRRSRPDKDGHLDSICIEVMMSGLAPINVGAVAVAFTRLVCTLVAVTKLQLQFCQDQLTIIDMNF